MRICHITSCFPPSYGGIETYVYNICKQLVEKGHQIRIITSSRGKTPGKYHEWVDGIEVIRYPERFHILEAPIIPRIALHALFEDCDVLHIHGMTPTITDFSLILGKLFGRKPVVLTYHFDAETVECGFVGRFASKVYAHVTRLIVKFADKIVATSKRYAETSLVLRGFSSKIVIIPCGVDLEKFRFYQKDGNVEMNCSDGACRYKILYVGKLSWYKGIEYLIKAMEIVTKTTRNVQLIIVGHGPQRDKLSSLVKEIGLKNYIFFAGSVPEESLYEYYQTTDLLILPSYSRREAFGIVLLEAMACGKPVIASNIPGLSSVIENDRSGLLVHPEDPLSLADAIVILLINDDKRKKMGTYARKFVEANYDWDHIATVYERIYNQISEAKRLCHGKHI